MQCHRKLCWCSQETQHQSGDGWAHHAALAGIIGGAPQQQRLELGAVVACKARVRCQQATQLQAGKEGIVNRRDRQAGWAAR